MTVRTSTLRQWWAGYRCMPESTRVPMMMFARNAGYTVTPWVDAVKAAEQALLANNYQDVKSIWIPRSCPTGISGKTCQEDGTNCSLHNYGIAFDIDPFGYGNPHFLVAFGMKPAGWSRGWDFRDCKVTEDQVRAVEAMRNTHGEQMWRWLGWFNGDTMHFEAQVHPTRTEVDWSTVPSGGMAMLLPFRQGEGIGDQVDRRSDVAWLQARVNVAYRAGLTQDGQYGPATAAALAPHVTDADGKIVTGNDWARIEQDYIRAISGSGSVDAYTKAESDQRFQTAGSIPAHGHRYAPVVHQHKGTITRVETVEVE